jgi:hypothetical protein
LRLDIGRTRDARGRTLGARGAPLVSEIHDLRTTAGARGKERELLMACDRRAEPFNRNRAQCFISSHGLIVLSGLSLVCGPAAQFADPVV